MNKVSGAFELPPELDDMQPLAHEILAAEMRDSRIFNIPIDEFHIIQTLLGRAAKGGKKTITGIPRLNSEVMVMLNDGLDPSFISTEFAEGLSKSHLREHNPVSSHSKKPTDNVENSAV